MELVKLHDAVEFGRDLIDKEDLDPIYSILNESKMPQSQLKRWCTAYWLFYNAGFASCASEKQGKDFWNFLLMDYPSHPRGAERRHFRGKAGLNCITKLREKFENPENMVDWIFDGKKTSQETIAKAQELPMFGPWISWKLSDMGERVLGYDLAFDASDLYMYRDPVMGAALVAFGDWKAKINESGIKEVVQVITRAYEGCKAPPKFDRAINVQEVETVLCKYKAHVKGFYPRGKDSIDIAHGLQIREWGDTSKLLLECLNKRCPYSLRKPDPPQGLSRYIDISG